MNALLQAARRHDLAELTRRIEAGANARVVSEAGLGVLSYLVQPPAVGDENDWKAQSEHVLSTLFDDEGDTPLYPSGEAELAALRLCLAHGADLEAADSVGDTALAYAAIHGNLPAAALLMDAGAECLRLTAFGQSPLLYALNEGRIEIARQMLGRAAAAGRLNEIREQPEYQRAFDRQTDSMLAMLEEHLPDLRAERAERDRIARLQGALEWQPEPDPPIRLALGEWDRQRAELASGPILKICLHCLYPYQAFYPYAGSRYGQVGGYGCPRCGAYFSLLDDDMLNSRLHYDYFDGQYVKGRDHLIAGPWDKVDLLPLTLDYARLYRLDVLEDLERLHGGPLFDALRARRDYASLTELLACVQEAFPAARAPQRFDNRLDGRISLPPEADAWVNVVRTLLPGEAAREIRLVADAARLRVER